jgi:hypothetical protein
MINLYISDLILAKNSIIDSFFLFVFHSFHTFEMKSLLHVYTTTKLLIKYSQHYICSSLFIKKMRWKFFSAIDVHIQVSEIILLMLQLFKLLANFNNISKQI